MNFPPKVASTNQNFTLKNKNKFCFEVENGQKWRDVFVQISLLVQPWCKDKRSPNLIQVPRKNLIYEV